jgi:heat shock protein HslJ
MNSKPILLLLLISILLPSCKPSEKAGSAANLENTYWKLAKMGDKLVMTPENEKEVHIVLAKEGDTRALKGFAGCNAVGGDYTTEGNKITFTVISTKMFCEDRMDVENFLMAALNSADRYTIKEETLELYQGDKLLAKFESVYL